MNFCKGNILISTPDTLGDIFSRSVILIIEHDEGGAFGLILNKMDETASREITQRLNFHAEVYDGGPLRDQRSFFLIKGDLSKEGYRKHGTRSGRYLPEKNPPRRCKNLRGIFWMACRPAGRGAEQKLLEESQNQRRFRRPKQPRPLERPHDQPRRRAPHLGKYPKGHPNELNHPSPSLPIPPILSV